MSNIYVQFQKTYIELNKPNMTDTEKVWIPILDEKSDYTF